MAVFRLNSLFLFIQFKEFRSKFKTIQTIKKFSKILFRFLIVILLLLIAISFALSTPVVQTALAKYATKTINGKYNLNTSIGLVAIRIDGDVILKKVKVLDDHLNTLANTEQIHTNILDFQKLIEGQLFFGNTKLDKLDFHIRTYKGDSLTNLDKFIEVFDDGKPGSGKFLMQIKNAEFPYRL